MINKFYIHNFKCFNDEAFDFTNLNILTGKNSSGKTSVIQALLLMFQTLEGKSGNILNGRYVKLGQYSDIQNIFSRHTVSLELITDRESYQYTVGEIVESSQYKYLNQDIIYLSANRIGVRNEYERNEQDIERIGIQGEYAFDYLSRHKMENMQETDFVKEKESGMNLGNQVDFWLEYLTGYSVSAEVVEGTSVVKVSYKSVNNPKEFRPYHVGTGVSYLATVIIAALSCTKESVLIIENPEVHLHPGAQSKFIEFFSFLASRGLQIILETHSDHIINGVRKEIRKQNINIQQVGVYFMTRDARGSKTVEINFTQKGAIINMQDGFFDQFDEDLDELIGFNDYEE